MDTPQLTEVPWYISSNSGFPTAPETKTLQEVFDETSKEPRCAETLGNAYAYISLKSGALRNEPGCTDLTISEIQMEDPNYQASWLNPQVAAKKAKAAAGAGTSRRRYSITD
jgi:hypothetical protein